MRTSDVLVLIVVEDAALRAVLAQGPAVAGFRVATCGAEAGETVANLARRCDWLVADEALVADRGLPMPRPDRTILIVAGEAVLMRCISGRTK